MFDFSYSSIDEMIELLARNINPFSGLKFKAREEKQVTEMMSIIYAAVNDEELYFDPVTAFIPTLDIGIIIKKSTSIQPFAKKNCWRNSSRFEKVFRIFFARHNSI